MFSPLSFLPPWNLLLSCFTFVALHGHTVDAFLCGRFEILRVFWIQHDSPVTSLLELQVKSCFPFWPNLAKTTQESARPCLEQEFLMWTRLSVLDSGGIWTWIWDMSRRVNYTVYHPGAALPRLNQDLYKMHLYFTKVAVSTQVDLDSRCTFIQALKDHIRCPLKPPPPPTC